MKTTNIGCVIGIIGCLFAIPAVAQNGDMENAKKQAGEHFQQGEWQQAASGYAALVKLDPQFRQGWFRLGFAQHSLGNFSEAATAYQKAIALGAPPIAQYNLACAFARLGKTDSALDMLEQSLNAGFTQQTTLESDTDFASLLDNARFKELNQRMLRAAFPCKYDPRYRQFDFWIGEWEVYNPAGQKVGTNSIQQILGSCVLLENWTSGAGSMGKSFNTFNTSTGTWQQTWVDDQGTVIELAGVLKGKTLTLEGTTRDTAGAITLHRLSFTSVDANTVRQFWEQSTDNGATWNAAFDGKYVRKAE